MDHSFFDSSALWHCTRDTNSLAQTEGQTEARHVPPREQDGREETGAERKKGLARVTYGTLNLDIWAV